MSELDQLRQEAEQLKNQIRVRSACVCSPGACIPGHVRPGLGDLSCRAEVRGWGPRASLTGPGPVLSGFVPVSRYLPV